MKNKPVSSNDPLPVEEHTTGDESLSDIERPPIEDPAPVDVQTPVSSGPEEAGVVSAKRARRMVIRVLLAAVAVICLISGILLLGKRPTIEKQRTESAREMIEKIEIGVQTIIVDGNEFAVEGEGYENFAEEDESSNPDPLNPDDVFFSHPEKVVLTAVGTLSIEAVDLNLPLWDDAGIVPLRYGAGVYKGSVIPGQTGNLVVLGHRMKTYGSIFNRLDEVKVGDEVVIITMDGNSHTYIVDEIIDALVPKKLPEYLTQEKSEGAQLTLVTCTPTGVGSHRLLVIAHLAEA